ncbi:hypothetical protein Tco_1143433 [Tanacetum coccineum]
MDELSKSKRKHATERFKIVDDGIKERTELSALLRRDQQTLADLGPLGKSDQLAGRRELNLHPCYGSCSVAGYSSPNFDINGVVLIPSLSACEACWVVSELYGKITNGVGEMLRSQNKIVKNEKVTFFNRHKKQHDSKKSDEYTYACKSDINQRYSDSGLVRKAMVRP